jgi:hypothetical protein
MWITTRKFPKKSVEEVLARDECCVICSARWYEWTPIETLHHAFFWWIYANYSEDRNNADQLIWLCNYCHTEFAHKSNTWREFCMNYLKAYYE